MGTSRVVRAPPTTKWNQVVGALLAPERATDFIADATLSIALGCLASTTPVNVPIIYGMIEGVKFLSDVNEYGIDEAAERSVFRITKTYLIPSVSDALWNRSIQSLDPNLIDTPFSRLAETAFKKTLNQIMIKGINVFEEEL